ncbi:hypothetical protein BDW42DRAFT_164227 [Aspergillus taichungensis]|uniref:Uncharacterized protein n=1 Tax=Aspergillus taichungensis TaxID=482145 RepID=A0A2J5I1V7_9EURO|nr:hypothetical protein BDW42DRAFT_164227 [Aspergillus taichungensis]
MDGWMGSPPYQTLTPFSPSPPGGSCPAVYIHRSALCGLYKWVLAVPVSFINHLIYLSLISPTFLPFCLMLI